MLSFKVMAKREEHVVNRFLEYQWKSKFRQTPMTVRKMNLKMLDHRCRLVRRGSKNSRSTRTENFLFPDIPSDAKRMEHNRFSLSSSRRYKKREIFGAQQQVNRSS